MTLEFISKPMLAQTAALQRRSHHSRVRGRKPYRSLPLSSQSLDPQTENLTDEHPIFVPANVAAIVDSTDQEFFGVDELN